MSQQPQTVYVVTTQQTHETYVFLVEREGLDYLVNIALQIEGCTSVEEIKDDTGRVSVLCHHDDDISVTQVGEVVSSGVY